jgi:hypothetical protein
MVRCTAVPNTRVWGRQHNTAEAFASAAVRALKTPAPGGAPSGRVAPDLDPSEDEQDERYDERTDRVLAGDMIRARLKPREKRGKATHWNQPVCGGDGKEQDAKKPGDKRQGAVHRVGLRRPDMRALRLKVICDARFLRF